MVKKRKLFKYIFLFLLSACIFLLWRTPVNDFIPEDVSCIVNVNAVKELDRLSAVIGSTEQRDKTLSFLSDAAYLKKIFSNKVYFISSPEHFFFVRKLNILERTLGHLRHLYSMKKIIRLTSSEFNLYAATHNDNLLIAFDRSSLIKAFEINRQKRKKYSQHLSRYLQNVFDKNQFSLFINTANSAECFRKFASLSRKEVSEQDPVLSLLFQTAEHFSTLVASINRSADSGVSFQCMVAKNRENKGHNFIFDVPSYNSPVDNFVTSDSAAYHWNAYFDPLVIWSLLNTSTAKYPLIAQRIKNFDASIKQGLGFDIKENILPAIGNEIGFTIESKSDIIEKISDMDIVFFLEVNNENLLAALAEALTSTFTTGYQQNFYRDVLITRFPIETLGLSDASYCFFNNYFFLASDQELLKNIRDRNSEEEGSLLVKKERITGMQYVDMRFLKYLYRLADTDEFRLSFQKASQGGGGVDLGAFENYLDTIFGMIKNYNNISFKTSNDDFFKFEIKLNN